MQTNKSAFALFFFNLVLLRYELSCLLCYECYTIQGNLNQLKSMIVLTYFVGTLALPALLYFPTLSNFRKNMFVTVTKKGSVLFEKLAQITSDPFTASETTMYTFLRVIYRVTDPLRHLKWLLSKL